MQSPSSEFINTMIKAGAGAGKTYGLIHKIVDLVREYTEKNSGELPHFVVTTFTRKATQEVRERLLSKALELRKSEPEFGELFLTFLKSSGLLMVSTIHGVLNQFLRQHGGLIGLDPDFKIKPTSDILLSSVFHELLSNEQEMPLLVSEFGWRRLKLFFLEHHRSTILKPELKALPQEIFSKYWSLQVETLESAIQNLKPEIESKLLKSKSDSLKKFDQSLNQLLQILNLENDLWTKINQLKSSYLTVPKSLGALTNWSEEAKENRKIVMTILSEFVEDGWTTKELFDEHQNKQFVLAEIAAKFSQQWFKRKIALAELELEDLELLSLYILRTFPDQVKSFSESWNYWFIDEYQDTSPIQVEILNGLVGNSPHYVVGDPQQSIYFFRGARSKVFHEKFIKFSESGANTQIKKINRRSQTPTLNFINDLMKRVNDKQFSPMESIDEKQTSQLMVGHFYLVPEDPYLHSDSVVKVLENLLQSGVSASDIAILCRENSELQFLFTETQAAGLPVQISSQGRFLEDRDVRDSLVLWTFLINPFNDTNLIELLRSPWFRISDEDLFLHQRKDESSHWDSLSKFDHPIINKLNEALQQLNQIGHVETWQLLIMNSSAIEVCRLKDPSGRKEGNLWKLINLITEQERQGTLNFTDPLDLSLKTDSNNENEAKSIRDSNQIQLMTIHASKGLEFDHVVLPYLNHTRKKEGADFWTTDLNNEFWTISMINKVNLNPESSFFAKKNAEETHELLSEESERLFYVAVTRAKKELHFFPPIEPESFSTSGWALHLDKFLSHGLGTFQSENSDYEFSVELASDLQHKKYTTVHNSTDLFNKGQILDLKEFLKISSPLQTNSVTVTQLTSESVKESKNYSPNFWKTGKLESGIKVHRELESYFSSAGLYQISLSLKEFLDKAPFPLLDLLETGNPEWSFNIQAENQALQGQIDLWGRDKQNNIWIIDYKTGTAKNLEKAFEQLKYYAWALQKSHQAHSDEAIHLAVCFPLTHEYQVRTVLPIELRELNI